MKIAAKWTDDCSGKKDFDGAILRISTRYWPRGGGFYVLDSSGFHGNDARPEIKPSATSKIVLYHGEPTDGSYGRSVTLSERDFEFETQEEVQSAVEAWADDQFRRIRSALEKEFGAELREGK